MKDHRTRLCIVPLYEVLSSFSQSCEKHRWKKGKHFWKSVKFCPKCISWFWESHHNLTFWQNQQHSITWSSKISYFQIVTDYIIFIKGIKELSRAYCSLGKHFRLQFMEVTHVPNYDWKWSNTAWIFTCIHT